MMFRVIGGIVVYGLALYGVAKLLACRSGGIVEAGNKPDDQHRSAHTEAMDRPTNEQLAGMDVDSIQVGG